MTDQWDRLMSRLDRFRALRASRAELESAIAGWHIEGPFLSSEPGFCGAHDPDLMVDPTPEQLRQLRKRSGNDPVLLTLAPERPGAIEAIALAVSLGIKVSLGHTDASAEVLRCAVRAGATGFTHLGNACPQQLDRHDNILWRVLDQPGLTVSLIPDGRHVSPALFRLIHRLLPSSALFYTTDAVTPAGAPPGRYSCGPAPGGSPTRQSRAPARPDQFCRLPVLRPVDGVLRAAEMVSRPWQSVWDFLSIRPAQFIGGPRLPWSYRLTFAASARTPTERSSRCAHSFTA